MKDERFVFIDDIRQKKNVARSAHNRRTHNGKRGAVKLPSDFLTAKELKAMNGEVKTYRLNDPMAWYEFNAMPDDVKISYIKALREKFHVSDSKIAKMMNVNQCRFSVEVRRLNIGLGRNNPLRGFKQKEWESWLVTHGGALESEPEEKIELNHEKVNREEAVESIQRLIPSYGKVSFTGSAEEVFRSVSQIIGGGAVRITIEWEALTEGAVNIG